MLENLLVVWIMVGIFGGVTVLFLSVMMAALRASESKNLTDRVLLVIKPFGIGLAFAILWPALFGLLGANILNWMLTGKNLALVDKLHSLI